MDSEPNVLFSPGSTVAFHVTQTGRRLSDGVEVELSRETLTLGEKVRFRLPSVLRGNLADPISGE